MVYVRPGERIGCNLRPISSSLKKSGVLVQNYCWKCRKYCWLYLGKRLRWIRVIKHRK